MHQSSKTPWWKIGAAWLLFSAPFALAIYLTLRDAIPLLAEK